VSDGPRYRGAVVWWNDVKGYGFVRPVSADRTGDVFLGRTAIERADIPEPAVGDVLSFEIGFDKQQRPRAENVSRIDETVARIWPPREPVRP
jgi:cold shock CspA family protein